MHFLDSEIENTISNYSCCQRWYCMIELSILTISWTKIAKKNMKYFLQQFSRFLTAWNSCWCFIIKYLGIFEIRYNRQKLKNYLGDFFMNQKGFFVNHRRCKKDSNLINSHWVIDVWRWSWWWCYDFICISEPWQQERQTSSVNHVWHWWAWSGS